MLKLRVRPIHPWTIGQTAASSAFRLTSEVTANCPQQKQPERCERTAVFVHSKPCANFVLRISFTLFTHSYNSQPVEVVDKFFDTAKKKWVSKETTVPSKQSEPCERTAERKVSLLENNLALFVHSKLFPNFLLLISLTLFTQTPTWIRLSSCWSHGQILGQGSRELGILTGRSWHFSNISSDISAWWARESTSLDVSKANGMLTSHAKRIFSDNVTCFGKNKSCSNRSHLPQCFIKALRFLLAWLDWCLHGHTCKKLEKGSRR